MEIKSFSSAPPRPGCASCPIKLSIETTLFYCLSCPCLFLNHDVHSPGQGYWRHCSAAALIGNHGQWSSRRLSAKVTSHLVKTSKLEVAADAVKGIPGQALARDGHVEKYGTVLRISSLTIRFGGADGLCDNRRFWSENSLTLIQPFPSVSHPPSVAGLS